MDDHVMMISSGGVKQALPCSQILHWSRQGLFNLETGESKVGWTYIELEAGAKAMKAWTDYQNELSIQKKLASEAPVERDGGAPTAHLHKQPTIVPPAPVGPDRTDKQPIPVVQQPEATKDAGAVEIHDALDEGGGK